MIKLPYRYLLIFCTAVFLCAASLPGQSDLIIQEKVSVASTLSGTVDVQITKAPVIGAKVELFSSDWNTVLASTVTSETGHFSFGRVPPQKLFNLQISAPGMNSYRLRARISKHSDRKLLIVLSVAS